MTRLGVFVLVGALALAPPVHAQLAAPNSRGVSMGHLHYTVRDTAANKAFWVALGGQGSTYVRGEIVRFPGVLVLISAGEPQGGSEGSVVNHVAFRVESLDAVAANGLALEPLAQFPGIASVRTPEGERIELFDEGVATNIGFELAEGVSDAVAERHNRPLTAPIVTHHVHFYVPEADVARARDWYVEHFGATPGKRWRYEAADLPGMNLNFSAATGTLAPTRGRMLDHIGFEIVGLEAFCRRLEAAGVKFDQAYRVLPNGIGLAFFTDPWGTYVELTEGLATLVSPAE